MKNLSFLFGATAALLMLSCREEFLLNDVSFDLWCGEKLCTWQVDEGEVRKVATWHEQDTAVELVGTPAQISQLSKAERVDCIRFELIANVEDSARASVRLDFNDDGTIDFDQVIPTQPWKPVEFLIRTPKHYENIRFSVRKSGPGKAVIAQVGASEELECDGEPVVLAPQGDGAACGKDAECVDGLCLDGHCSACAASGTCANDALCEADAHCASGACVLDVLEPQTSTGTCSACAGAGSCSGGEACSDDAHCAGGVCAAGHCSVCAADGSCKGGAGCDEDAQCGSGECLGSVCAECTDSAQCDAGSQCVQGFCSECASDDECGGTKLCAFSELGSKWPHTCQTVQDQGALLPGQLCIADAQCVSGQRCGSLDARLSPRCGIACAQLGEACKGGGTCREVLAEITDDFQVKTTLVCMTDAICNDAAVCIDS